MSYHVQQDPKNRDHSSGEEYTPELGVYQPMHDESEGGEYLDDALRMHEQPLTIQEQEPID